jgi:hypothetical protein
MGGDDSQKLLPWRGIHSSPGRKPPAHGEINTVTKKCGWGLAGRHFPRARRSWLSYRLPGSFLQSRPGSLLTSAEGPYGKAIRAAMTPPEQSPTKARKV